MICKGRFISVGMKTCRRMHEDTFKSVKKMTISVGLLLNVLYRYEDDLEPTF